MRTEGRTDMTKLIVAFRHFANALKKLVSLTVFERHYPEDSACSLVTVPTEQSRPHSHTTTPETLNRFHNVAFHYLFAKAEQLNLF